MLIVLRVAFKPVATIFKPQSTVNIDGQATTMTPKGSSRPMRRAARSRHGGSDGCNGPLRPPSPASGAGGVDLAARLLSFFFSPRTTLRMLAAKTFFRSRM